MYSVDMDVGKCKTHKIVGKRGYVATTREKYDIVESGMLC